MRVRTFATLLLFCLAGSAGRGFSQTVNIIHNMTSTDGSTMFSGLVEGSDGYLYGVAATGGAGGLGSIFRVSKTGALQVMHSFEGYNGAGPYGQITLAKDGSFYGTTNSGGEHNYGTIWHMTVSGGAAATEVIHVFDGAGGNNPYSGVTLDDSGNIYGTTAGGGANGWGTIYVLRASGAFQVLYHFSFTRGGGGGGPYSRVTLGQDGWLYGVTRKDGADRAGAVFQLKSDGSQFGEESLYSDTGVWIYSDLLPGADGYFYASAVTGGTYNTGTVFRVSLASPAPEVVANMPQFSAFAPFNPGVQLGNYRYLAASSDEQATAGKLLTLDVSGNSNIFYTFWGYNGYKPTGQLLQASDGNLYGTTQSGGTNNAGVIYQIVP